MEHDNDHTVSAYDRAVGSLEGVPGTFKTRPSLHRLTEAITGISQTFVVTTVRHIEQGDRIFLEIIQSADQPPIRVVLPPKVANTIARQREALSKRARRAAFRARAPGGMPAGFAKMTPKQRKDARAKAAKSRAANAAKRRARKTARA